MPLSSKGHHVRNEPPASSTFVCRCKNALCEVYVLREAKIKHNHNLVSIALALVVEGLALVTHQVAVAAPLSADWIYKIEVVKGAPTPDMASKAIAMAGKWVGAVTVANGSDVGAIDGKGFTLRSHVKVVTLLSMLDSNLDMVRQSSGVFFSGIAFTLRYADKRGSNPELLLVSNLKQRQYLFTKGGGPARIEPMKYLMVDIAMLPYAFIGRAAPKATSFISFTDGKSIISTNLTPIPERLEVAGKLVPAVRLSGLAPGGTLDLWIREADGYPLHMRVGLNAKYGAVLDQRVVAVPTALFAL